MESVSFEAFLLLVLLILVGIVLFLSLVIAIYLIRLSREIVPSEKRKEPARKPVVSTTNQVSAMVSKPAPVAAPPDGVAPVHESGFDPSRDAPDIPTGMKNLCARYGLSSLTVSSSDGLVIASSGHSTAIADAAEFSYAFQTGKPIQEEGVQVFPVEFGNSLLVGILRGSGNLEDRALRELQKDISRLLERWI